MFPLGHVANSFNLNDMMLISETDVNEEYAHLV